MLTLLSPSPVMRMLLAVTPLPDGVNWPAAAVHLSLASIPSMSERTAPSAVCAWAGAEAAINRPATAPAAAVRRLSRDGMVILKGSRSWRDSLPKGSPRWQGASLVGLNIQPKEIRQSLNTLLGLRQDRQNRDRLGR